MQTRKMKGLKRHLDGEDKEMEEVHNVKFARTE
jgi:hypothetical protein